MSVTADRPAPYAPTATISEVMSRNRERGLPLPVNAENLGRIGVPASLVSRVQYALFSLDLIDEHGAPTATLENLRLAPEAEYKKRQEDWLKSAYADIFAIVDPSKDDETRIRDAFRNYQPIGQQARMVSLFQGLCAAAGLIPERPRAPRLAGASPPRPRVTNAGERVPPKGFYAAAKTVAAKAKVAPTGLPPAISGLLESLPAADEGWTKADRDRFYVIFGTVLDYAIPVIKTPHHGTKENSDQD